MEKLKKIFFIIIILLPGRIYSQQIYHVGVSQSSIAPKNELISLALGGYASPWEGRFTLQWINKGAIPPVTDIVGVSHKLYLISNNTLYCVNPNPKGNISDWEQIGKANNISHLTGSNDNLFALNKNGELLVKKLKKKKAGWERLGNIDIPVQAITSVNNTIYLADKSGTIWSADISEQKIKWTEIESLKLDNVISLTANNRKLYALTNEGVIFQSDIFKYKWIKSAYRNNVSINENIQHITITDNTIFGVDKENTLFEGEHRSKEDLSARAVAIKDNKNTIVIVSLDLVGINKEFTGLVKKEIFQSHGIPPSAIFINLSHTHFAPVTQAWPTWQEHNQLPDSVYLHSIKNEIKKNVANAIDKMQPAKLYFGRGTTDIGFNRSLKDHPELYDSDVDVIKIDYTDNETENYLFLAACHPVHSTSGKFHYTVSANFPGVARSLVEQMTGTENSIFLQGTAGDINPRDNDEFITGKKLANEVIAVINRSMDKVSGPVSSFLDTINIPIVVKTKEEIIEFEEQNLNKTDDITTERDLKWCEIMLKKYEENKMPTSLPVYVHTINIGNWKLIGYSRETTSEYSIEVKKMWPDKLISIAGFTNDVSSYLPTKKHIEKQNYEGYGSFFWYGMPSTFPSSVDDTIISFIKENKR
jgi:hypothetical protein